MEEEMEDMVEYTVVEVDLDYEFDAPFYFDFTRDESVLETGQAESWFESAASYPPSPFVTRLIMKEDILLESINVSPKSKAEDNIILAGSDSDMEFEQGVPPVIKEGMRNGAGISANLEISNAEKLLNELRQLPSGLTFYNHMAKDNTKGKTKSSGKPSCPRTSTLMKPTASHLAKQNPRPMGESRLQTLLVEKNGTNSVVIETQAAKRQKLEGGHLRKVAEAKPVINFVHKAPKRDGKVDGNDTFAKPRITIPREPELQTTHRAQRGSFRPKANEQAENLPPAVRRFKALPLNRKIFEGPSLIPKRSNPQLPHFQEFHLKTSERAVLQRPVVSVSAANSSTTNKIFEGPSLTPKRSNPQLPHFQEFHLKTSERAVLQRPVVSVSAASSSTTNKVLQTNTNSTMECGNKEFRRVNLVEASKEAPQSTYSFKALPLNKKILSSKGDIGVFRNTKREITVPMEFNFRTDKRIHHNPPIEMFNKLSLTSEPQPTGEGDVQLKSQKPSFLRSKGSKENRWAYFQQNNEIAHAEKGKLAGHKAKSVQFCSDVGTTEVCQVSNINRSLGIR